MTTFY